MTRRVRLQWTRTLPFWSPDCSRCGKPIGMDVPVLADVDRPMTWVCVGCLRDDEVDGAWPEGADVPGAAGFLDGEPDDDELN